MNKKSPQQLASEYQKDSAAMRAGFIKAMNLIISMDEVPEKIKQVAVECIEIISGQKDFVAKTTAIETEPKPPEPKPLPTEPTPLPEVPKNPAADLPKNPSSSANWRFRKRR
jgi:hypothetical protein